MNQTYKVITTGLLILLAVSCNPVDPDTGEFLPELEDTLFTEINQTRVAEGYQTLDLNTELKDFSRSHSKDMGDENYFSHTTPDGKELWDRFAESGITATAVGECIWMQVGGVADLDCGETASTIVEEWLADVADYTIVLDPDYNQGSVGCYRIDDKLYVTFNGIENTALR